jgi:IS1 family transposase
MASENLLFPLIVLGLIWWLLYHRSLCEVYETESGAFRRRWRLRPRSPKDCPQCQCDQRHPPNSPEIIPWSQVKSRRGRHKTLVSEGYACPAKACTYYGITDQSVHALVGDGVDGVNEPIQWWRCQACGERFSARHDTGMRWLKTPSWRVQEVVTALGEGVDQAAAVRIFGHDPTTIARWLKRAGQLDQPLHDRFFQNLVSAYVQLDELKTKTRRMGEVWIWVALDVQTRVMIALRIGPRTQDNAHRLIHEVTERLADEGIPVFSSDGLRMYFYALTAHYGRWIPPLPGKRAWQWIVDERLLFAQLHKVKPGYRLTDLKSFIRAGTRQVYRETLQLLGYTGKVETAYVERINLTLRQLIAPLSRRTWSLAHDEQALRLHVGWGRVYYHFARPHHSLRLQDQQGRYRQRTPAMAAKVVPKRLTVANLMLMPLPGLSEMS